MARSREFDALTPFVSVSPAIAGRERAELLREGISEALLANLSRGFLESEERFRQIVEGLHDVIWLTNPGGTQLYFVNAAYERIWGTPRAEMYENPMAFLESVHPDDRERVRAAIGAQPYGSYDVEFRIVRPAGDIRWVWSRGYPVRDGNGEIYRVGNIIEDITERRQIVESHERLVRGFTHDIKNPLGAADGYLALLEMGIYGPVLPAQSESLGRARAAIRNALTLITQLLDIERAQSGQLAIHWALTDVDAISSDIVRGFRAAADAKRLRLEQLPHRADDSVIESDPTLVRQILANLVSNAVKYTQPDGHVTVRAHATDGAALNRAGPWIGTEVADDGPGIPYAKQDMLFREFARFDAGAAEGSGIGLAISQRLAAMLGAVITFTSEPGVGSTFTLWLPVDPPIAAV